MSKNFVKFRPDNFTPSARTPWGGSYIVKSLKSGLDFNRPKHGVGESWEFSLDDDLPSLLLDTGERFSDFLVRESAAWLSEAHRLLWAKRSPLLVKYIDAKDDLSLQVHPPIDDHSLDAGLSGKWESWHVIEAQEGAGIYLGFKSKFQLEDFEEAIYSGRDIKAFLNFVPVAKGETYVIAPCTPHALGAGICVIEPQIISPTKQTLTLRLHDWNRRYDTEGRLSDSGQKRPLHVDAAFRHIKNSLIDGQSLETTAQVHARCVYQTQTLKVKHYNCMPYLQFFIVEGTGVYHFDAPNELGAVCTIFGTCELLAKDGRLRLNAGESGAASASLKRFEVICQRAKVFMAFAMPKAYSSAVQ